MFNFGLIQNLNILNTIQIGYVNVCYICSFVNIYEMRSDEPCPYDLNGLKSITLENDI